jgi:uncharacterized protein (TIGR02646 family)
MKYIEKKLSNEPRSLRACRSTPNANYDDCNKADIREALLDEQGHICAYCMRRIKEQPRTTDIEHYVAQSNDPKLKLNYLNMLGVCNMSDGKPAKQQHCDKSRKNQILTVNPLDIRCESEIKYDLKGKVYSDNDVINNDLDKILNLNLPRIMAIRKRVIETVRDSLKSKYKSKPNKTWQKSDINAEIKRLKTRENGKFIPFCQAAIFYLESKIARL